MRAIFRKSAKKAGLPPGSVVYVGEKKAEKAKITLIDYDQFNLEERVVGTIGECLPYMQTPTVTWINVDGIHQTEIIEEIGRVFKISNMILEDIVNTAHRPKMEEIEEAIFFIVKTLYMHEEDGELRDEQVSIVLCQNLVISFKENGRDVFAPVIQRIRTGKGRTRKLRSDYLAYALIDAVVDDYFTVIESLGDKIERLDRSLISDPKTEVIQDIHHLKRELIFLRKSVWPLREVINRFERTDSSLVADYMRAFVRDLYDHTIQIVDATESYREMAASMYETYLSAVSNRMNEVMKVLTIFAAIFIPLTFIAGIYGMNFQYMPELSLRWGYFAALLLMLTVGLGLLALFKIKKWF